MHPTAENGGTGFVERMEALTTLVDEIAERVRATELATGGEKAARELRRAIEAVAKHDPKLESRLTERVEVLMDRFGTLASAVSTTSAELARRDGEIAVLRRELEQSSGRIEVLAKDVSSAARVADVAKLRDAIAARPVDRPTKRGEDRLDHVEGKLALLAERIDTLAPTVATAAARHAARDGELVNLRQELERSSGEVEQIVAELRADPRVAALGRRVDMLASELEAKTGKLAARDQEVAALRVRIDDAYAKAGAVISELQLALTTVGTRLSAVEQLPERVERALATRTGDLSARLEALSETATSTEGKLVELERASSEQAQHAAARTHELESLHGETSARLDAFERDRGAVTAEIDRVAKVLGAARAAVQVQLDELAATVERVEQSTASDDSRQRLDELDAQLGMLARTVASTAGKLAILETASSESIDRVANALDDERTSLRAQLDGLVAVVARVEQSTSGADSQRMFVELAERIDVLDGDLEATTGAMTGHELDVQVLRARIDEAYAKASAVISELQLSLGSLLSRVAGLEELPEGMNDALRAHEDALDTRLSQLDEASSGQADLLVDLGARISLGEQGHKAAREEIDRILDTWASDRSSLETRLDEVAATLGRSGADRAHAAISVEELTRLRVLVDGLQPRLAASEQEIAALRSAPDPGPQLDDIGGRLAALERDTHGVFVSSGAPVVGDGRFRLELRALELRLEQAEEDAREGRDAFVVQLERFASRIERRLELLESDVADPALADPTPTGAQVVPFRGAEA